MCSQNLMKTFQEMGFVPEVKPLTFFQDDYGLKIEGGDDEDEDEEEDDLMDGETEGSDENEEMSDKNIKERL